ncbi:phosphoenolpyruvate synthase [Spiractinospora alimapuensis]|uniref:rifamycin-inactivating phosphotransferase n=1 Tax=Spiractinospora alimapuensis TaxID=2820884 RepID=UPI001EEC12BF|nr:rifamycin-inactivating phosphotransferase [Spiractinospora alimapuensis]QVQ52781.1 phosphoenolpyruvate synthase [Spiractinospora alimapuensis]
MDLRYVMDFGQVNATNIADVGGKGAMLGELSHIDGVRVPDGFCVTTDAFQQVVAEAPSIDTQLDKLSAVRPDDHAAIRALSADVRRGIETARVPESVAAAIVEELIRIGEDAAYAVRSSATAEDLPTASFAGQQDSYLNVIGADAVLLHVRRCWASLFTDRAVTYRLHNGFDHRKVDMAVVVQRMVFPDAAGTMFTADPVTSNRRVATVEASWGFGEALVSGLVSGDVFTVRDDRVLSAEIATKTQFAQSSPGGGTHEAELEPQWRTEPTLSEAQVLDLVRLGRRIEAYFGRPQDIEWCRVGDDFFVVQSRAITTLFPVPTTDDEENHVYLSVGHQQMMTDAMTPLGLSFWQMTTPRPMHEAGGRLFVDIAPTLAAPSGRTSFLEMLGESDPLMRDAVRTVLDRGDFVREAPDEESETEPAAALYGAAPDTVVADPDLVTERIRVSEASVATLRDQIRDLSGPALLDFIRSDIPELKSLLFDEQSLRMIMAAMNASAWLNARMEEWLGEKNAADVLTQSVPHNVTSEMGLALLDVADAVRPHEEVVAFLHRVTAEGRTGDGFLDEMADLPGGSAARDAIRGYLDAYGMRCVGEIDITRPRWSEQPAALVPAILGNIRNFEPGEAERQFERGLRESQRKEKELLASVRGLSAGEEKAAETKRMIDLVRTFTGYREYPKYGMVNRYFLYKRALLREAHDLVEAGVLREPEDLYFLRFEELEDVVRTRTVDARLVQERREAFRTYETLTPPRVLTSDGEAISGQYGRDDAPAGALLGLPVSAGAVEGRARVVTDMARADLETGDILITAYTDPSWTPLFVTIAGLVTEVGGLMTHGAVVAREYGLPAVVGVDQATRRIQDGQRIRVHGTDGYVEFLD